MRRLTTGIAILVLPVLAACGGSSGGGSGGGSSNSPAPASSSPASGGSTGMADVAAAYDGTYVGTWKNTTFGSNGTAAATVATNKDAKTTGIKLTLNGNVFGSGVQPELITGKLTDTGFSFTGHSAIFGDVSVFTISSDGLLNLSATNTSSRVTKFTATGKVDKTTFTLNYTATLSTGPAQGTFTLSK